MDEDKRFSNFYIRKRFKKKVDLNKMDFSKIEVAESENTVAGSKVVVARTVVKRRKSERIKGKWLSRVPGNPPDKPIMLDESDTEEASPLQVERVNKTTKTVDNKVDCTQQPPAGTLLSDIAHLFPNVMDKNDVLQSEPNENREMPISDASKKGNDTGKKRKDKKAGIKPKEKKAAVIQTVKTTKEATHGSTIEDSDDDFDNPPWKKTRSGAGPQVVEKTQRPADARSIKDLKHARGQQRSRITYHFLMGN
ncbi:hypothetical protein HanPI659440_Chr06g0224741 [Helianthus annuus]|nr:hypothetical protein HanPI659440_Chr06g0224741 [Helianthus annuus]